MIEQNEKKMFTTAVQSIRVPYLYPYVTGASAIFLRWMANTLRINSK